MDHALNDFLHCCQQVLAGDGELIELLRHQGFACAAGHWHFRLPALHAFLDARLPAEHRTSYHVFRQALLTSPVNTRLRPHQGQILIIDNLGKVDVSLYGLSRLTAP
ncbi:MAG: hypothetical protein ABWY06_03135 [Pseudomonas sp.]|uniref:hypothetical protein n=1 Tax=Pseudomonas sp. TaxID=306 RepID=UPI0033959BAA